MIKFRGGYKYQLAETYERQIEILEDDVHTEFITLTPDGNLTIRSGYAWDGPSGPAIDTLTFMRASLVHDALYQLMRLGLLPQDYRNRADKIMQMICKDAGMWKVIVWWVYLGVKIGAKEAAKPKNKRKIIEAP